MKILILQMCACIHIMGYMLVHLYYVVCALYNAACIREESVKDIYSGLYM